MTHQREAVERNAARNTDRELWREEPGDYYSPSIHVTAQGAIGINVGGSVIVQSVRQWHNLAKKTSEEPTEVIRRLAEMSDEDTEMVAYMLLERRRADPVLDARCKRVAAMLDQQSGNSHE